MKTCRLSALFVFFLLLGAAIAAAAVYKSQCLDGIALRAVIRLQDHDTDFHCSVVFRRRAANIVLDLNQVLPMVPRNDRFMTLYLFTEEITDPQKISAKLVTDPPENVADPPPPEEWPARSLWWIRISEPLPDQAVES
ncbi:MAG: hypothetical protein RB296_00030 [Acidobacteriota bacterium]|nr:hypothetical protein [Acidobacteriota bacterium]